MATHDYVIDNQSASAFRSDLNGALQAIVTQNSSATAPTTTYADMIWYDSANNQLKKRNEANSAWITLGTVDEGAGTFTPSSERALATQAQAEAGTDNATLMTPLRVAEAIIAQAMTPGFTSTETTLSRDGRWTFAHGLGVVPSRVQMNLRCVISERNFSVNDVVYYNSVVFDPNSGFGVQLSADTTNVYLGVYYVYVRDKTTGTGGANPTWLEITYANWRASVLAWK